MSDIQRVRAVTNCTAVYMQRFSPERWLYSSVACAWRTDDAAASAAMTEVYAQLLLATGCGPARLSVCAQALRRPLFDYDDATRTVVRRTLSLFRQGELQELCVCDPALLDLIVSGLPHGARDAPSEVQFHSSTPQHDPQMGSHSNTVVAHTRCGSPDTTGSDALPTQSSAPVVRSLRSLELTSHKTRAWSDVNTGPSAFVLIALCTDTIKEIDCDMDYPCEGGDEVLSKCTRLELLTSAHCFTPSVWLGLSQLHTLRGVDLQHVSIHAIAAALPRLHTLEAFSLETRQRSTAPAGGAGFFEMLLPRLRSFSFRGRWSRDEHEQHLVGPRPLPLLQELIWHCISCEQQEVHRGFLGAQPLVLATSAEVIADWLRLSDRDVTTGETRWCPFARARAVRFEQSSSLAAQPTPIDIERTLHAAPELRALTICGFRDPPSWITLEGTACGFTGLVHTRLSTIEVDVVCSLFAHTGDTSRPPADYVARLRHRCFPRLKCLTYTHRDHYTQYFATSLDQ